MSVKNSRIFLETSFKKGELLPLGKEHAHYLRSVMRLQLGENIIVFNGFDGEWKGIIEALSKKEICIRLQEQLKAQPKSQFLGLLFPPIRQTRLDFMIEKATELGVTDFFPVQTERTVISKINNDRLRKIAIEASEQSERLTIPAFHPLRPLRETLKDWNATLPVIMAVERETGEASDWSHSFLSGVAVLIGPEGGFSPQEKETIRQFNFIHRVSLGEMILRTETAAIAALSIANFTKFQ